MLTFLFLFACYFTWNHLAFNVLCFLFFLYVKVKIAWHLMFLCFLILFMLIKSFRKKKLKFPYNLHYYTTLQYFSVITIFFNHYNIFQSLQYFFIITILFNYDSSFQLLQYFFNHYNIFQLLLSL